MSVFRPLFVEVPGSVPRDRFGVSNLSGLTALYRKLYACPHEHSDIYGVHAVWCDALLPEPDDKCTCDRVKRRCCECGAPTTPQVPASAPDE